MRLTYSVIFLALMSIITINSADLRSDFRDFINLIPRNRLTFLAGRHLLFDTKFQTAFNFLRSSKFKDLVRNEFSQNQEVHDVIEYLGRDIDLNSIVASFAQLVIRIRPVQEYGRVRTLTNFMLEVAELLPNDKIKKLIKQKNAADPEFSMLYEKVTDPQFKVLVYKARNSNILAGSFKTLRSNEVDVDQFLQIAFKQIVIWSNIA